MKKSVAYCIVFLIQLSSFYQVANSAVMLECRPCLWRGGNAAVYMTNNCQRVYPPIYDSASPWYILLYVPPPYNDVLLEFSGDPNFQNTKIAIPKYYPPDAKWMLQPLRDWLDANLPANKVIFPSISDSTGEIQQVYTMIDLSQWLTDPRPIQNAYVVTNGTCPDLPGYLIGTTPIVFDSLAAPGGYPFSTTPLNGTLYLDAEVAFFRDHAIHAIPTMTEWGLSVLALLIISTAVWVLMRRRASLSV